MKFEILLNSVLRLPLNKANKLYEEYQKNGGFKNFAEQQRVSDIFTHKFNMKRQIKEEVFNEVLISLALMIRGKSSLSNAAFESIKGYPMTIWIECIGSMNFQQILSLLNNYGNEFPSSLIETCIVNLPEDMQLKTIAKYKNKLSLENDAFFSFYYSVCPKARLKLKEYFEIEDNILLELEDMNEVEVREKLSSDYNRLMKIPADDLVEFILLKSHKLKTLNKFFELFNEKINECSTSKFEFLLTRYRYLSNCKGTYFKDEDKNTKILTDNDLFKLFNNRFHQLGIAHTLSLFDNSHPGYAINQFTVNVVLDFLDIAYSDCNLTNYMNDDTKSEIIVKFVEKCNSKNYSLDDFATLVKNIANNKKTKLIHDDYIEAIIACGKLLKLNKLNDQDPLFLELRNKFTIDLISRCQKDGTYKENISLNGIFYRLAKGSIPFEKVYMTQTYKGLIYLTKSGKSTGNADFITTFLTDYQLAKLNVKPVIRWKNTIKINSYADNLSFVESMGLQLLCYFGKDKGKYLLESNMKYNRMENLFDGLKYGNIAINDKGDPIINEDLINYLFGRGMAKEHNSVINRMIRKEIPEFEKYFTEFCNSFKDIQKACNGILSVRRIIDYFEDFDLPIELKPDEIEFKPSLKQMNTTDLNLLSEAIELCKDARARTFSSIPKVSGKLGSFTYKILDLNDPMALTVGYLSHCCFLVRGISYSSLKHSMQSENGRTFVVYYNNRFFAQSWVWRNGDVICFDSIEKEESFYNMHKEDIKLIDVYQQAANQMLSISKAVEDEEQRVKVVTVGSGGSLFSNLESVKIATPLPLENNLYLQDSAVQQILAGAIPETLRYGSVKAKYKDPLKEVIYINEDNFSNADLLDKALVTINSLRYQIKKEDKPLDYNNYNKIIVGDGFYILISDDIVVESGVLDKDSETIDEYNKYLENSLNSKDASVKKLTLSNKTENR